MKSFGDADVLLVTEIYAASEEKIDGVCGEALAGSIHSGGHPNVIFAPTREEMISHILQDCEARRHGCNVGRRGYI